MRWTLCISALASAPVTAALPPLFAELSTDKDGIYQNERFHLLLSVFVSGETLDKQLSLDGLPAPDRMTLQPYEELSSENTVREGTTYEVRRYRWAARVPEPGPLTIRLDLRGTLLRVSQQFFFRQTTQQAVRVPVADFSLVIRPLPLTERPPGFSGAVGSYTFQAAASPLDVAVGDLVTLTYSIAGDPLPASFTPPSVRPTPSLRVYETKAAIQEGSSTCRVFLQTVVPADATVTAVPSVSFTYFDGRSNAYRTVTSGPFPLAYHAERPPLQQLYTPTGLVTGTQAVQSSVVRPSETGVTATFWTDSLRTRLSGGHEAVIGSLETPARLAPSQDAKLLFKVKPGTRVELDSEWRDWVRISCQNGIGWVPASSLKRD